METSLHFDTAQKQLGFKLREKITTKYNIELKAKGLLNTTNGALDYRGTAMKCFSVGTIKEVGSTPIRLGMGVAAVSGSKDPLLTVCAKKKFALLDGPNTILSAKVESDMDTHGTASRRLATIKLSHKALNFTKKQDLKLTAGLDVDWPVGARRPVPSVLLQVRENNWAAHLRRDRWFLTYDM